MTAGLDPAEWRTTQPHEATAQARRDHSLRPGTRQEPNGPDPRRRSPAERLNTSDTTCEWVTAADGHMTCAVGKRMRERLTAKVSGPQNAGPLDRRVRPEGQKGTPCLEDVRGPRKTAGPRKRRSAARRIAGGAWLASAGGPKGLKAFGTGRSAEISGCAHRVGDGTNGRGKPTAECGSA